MEIVVILLVGLMMLYFAYAIGIQHKIGLLHEYHYQNLKEANKDAYLKVMGIGFLIMGVGCLSAVMMSFLWGERYVVILVGGIVLGLVVLIGSQYKYNGSIFSLTDGKHNH